MSDLRPENEIADGIHWIKSGHVNYYIIEDGDELLMVDTGMSKKPKQFYEYVKQELESKTLSKILLTHHHIDHIGGLYHLHEAFNPRIFAHPHYFFPNSHPLI